MATFNPTTGTIDGSVLPTFFFRADVLTLTDGTAVSAVDDVTGGTQWTQATGSRQPAFKTNIFGTKPSLLFDGTADMLARDTNVNVNFGTLFVLTKPTSTITTATASVCVAGISPPSAGQLHGILGGAVTGGLTNEIITVQWTQSNRSAWTQAGATIPAANPNIITARWDSGTARYHIFHDGSANKTSAITGTPALINTDVVTLAATTVPEFFFGGHIGVFLSYSTVLSDAQKAAVHSYLQDVWGAVAADYDPGWTAAAAPPPESLLVSRLQPYFG